MRPCFAKKRNRFANPDTSGAFLSLLALIIMIALSSPVFAQTGSDLNSETADSSDNTAPSALSLLTSKSFKDKQTAIEMIADKAEPSAIVYLESLLNAKLYFLKDSKEVVVAQRAGKQFKLSDPVSGEDLGSVESAKVSKISINNSLRGLLKNKIASLSLQNPDTAIRLKAVQEMIRGDTGTLQETLSPLLETEQDPSVREVMQVGIALSTLDAGGPSETRLAALEELSGSLNQTARNKLASLAANAEEDPAIIAAAKSALLSIEQKIKFYALLETLFFGLSLGSVLVLAAIGLAITFGVMGVINM
ncbi:MAG: urea ABC transporter permease subunit UrtB, partial [Gammaproteobacteria bacterium]|nr:urea ABC transporter permease subunit UrtB [Gammaproteobacteria bacterium]